MLDDARASGNFSEGIDPIEPAFVSGTCHSGSMPSSTSNSSSKLSIMSLWIRLKISWSLEGSRIFSLFPPDSLLAIMTGILLAVARAAGETAATTWGVVNFSNHSMILR